MKCRALRANLIDYLDGRVTDDLQNEIESEIASCSQCRSRIEEAKTLRAALASLPRKHAPADLLPAILADIRARNGFEPRNPRLLRRVLPLRRVSPHHRRMIARAAAAMIVAIGLGIVAWNRGLFRDPTATNWPVVFVHIDRDLSAEQQQLFRDADPFAKTSHAEILGFSGTRSASEVLDFKHPTFQHPNEDRPAFEHEHPPEGKR